jgi:hypothetical protein
MTMKKGHITECIAVEASMQDFSSYSARKCLTQHFKNCSTLLKAERIGNKT